MLWVLYIDEGSIEIGCDNIGFESLGDNMELRFGWRGG